MGQWVLLDWDRELATIENETQLEAELGALRAKVNPPNTIVNLVSPTGHVLSVAIASRTDRGNEDANFDGERSCMNFMQASQNPPYLKVVGDPALTDADGLVVFMYEEQWTEIPLRNTVTVSVMLRAARDFFRTEQLPQWIPWEEV
jgi:hypothetical protein